MKTTKQRKKERADERFRAQFHSAKRVKFIRGLPCDVTGLTRSGSPFGRIVNAHTKGGGTGRRGPYESIVPLKWDVHSNFDDGMTEEQFEDCYGRTKQSIRDRAPHYHRLWLEHVGEAA